MADLAHEYGYRLKTFNEDDANDLIAQEFQQWAARFIDQHLGESSRIYGDIIYIHFRFVEKDPFFLRAEEDHAIEAWVRRFDDTSCHIFGIFVSMAMVRSIFDVFTAMVLGPEVIKRGVTEEDMAKNFETGIYPFVVAALIFVMLHELSHVIRAHIPFVCRDNFASRAGLSQLTFHMVNPRSINEIPLSRESWVRLHRSMEIDADLIAIGLIIEFLSSGIEFYSGKLMNQPFVFGQAVAIMSRLLEQWRRAVSNDKYEPHISIHPHPDIRYVFFTAWLLARKKENDRSEKFIEAAVEFEKGLDAANEKMAVFGTQFFPLFEYLEATGRDAYLDEFELIRVDLYYYLRPELEVFRIDDWDD